MPDFSPTVAETRTKKCAIHLVAAAVFRESANRAVSGGGAFTLSCIGYYYSAFHIAVSALWITETVSPNSLRRVSHATVRKLVEQHLKQPKKIKPSFMTQYLVLQDLREESNYRFFFSAKNYDYSQIALGLDGRTEAMFSAILPYIRNRLLQIDMLEVLQRYIGDGIGDDLIDIHVSPIARRTVQRWLSDHQFST